MGSSQTLPKLKQACVRFGLIFIWHLITSLFIRHFYLKYEPNLGDCGNLGAPFLN